MEAEQTDESTEESAASEEDGDDVDLPISEGNGWPLGTYILALGGGFLIFAGIVGCVLGA